MMNSDCLKLINCRENVKSLLTVVGMTYVHDNKMFLEYEIGRYRCLYIIKIIFETIFYITLKGILKLPQQRFKDFHNTIGKLSHNL